MVGSGNGDQILPPLTHTDAGALLNRFGTVIWHLDSGLARPSTTHFVVASPGMSPSFQPNRRRQTVLHSICQIVVYSLNCLNITGQVDTCLWTSCYDVRDVKHILCGCLTRDVNFLLRTQSFRRETHLSVNILRGINLGKIP